MTVPYEEAGDLPNGGVCSHPIEQPYEHPYPEEVILCSLCGQWRTTIETRPGWPGYEGEVMTEPTIDQKIDALHGEGAAAAIDKAYNDGTLFSPPTCSMCRRERTLGDAGHPMDAYDYTPMQQMTGQPLGWYSGDDGEVCPECMTKTLRG